jgi:hypothetical protein
MSMYNNTTPHTFNLEHYSTTSINQRRNRLSEIIIPLVMILIGCFGLFMMMSN